MANALMTQDAHAIMERVVIAGDLSALPAQQRVEYYAQVCNSVGLNPLTRPFEYIKLNGKLTLYAKKDATDQLRKVNGVSITDLKTDYQGDLIIVTAVATDKAGKSDSDVGVVVLGNKQGDSKANAIMKAVTKAKRRVTLSICGLGWLDESEIETMPPQVVQHVPPEDFDPAYSPDAERFVDAMIEEGVVVEVAVNEQGEPLYQASDDTKAEINALEVLEGWYQSGVTVSHLIGRLMLVTDWYKSRKHALNSLNKATNKDGEPLQLDYEDGLTFKQAVYLVKSKIVRDAGKQPEAEQDELIEAEEVTYA